MSSLRPWILPVALAALLAGTACNQPSTAQQTPEPAGPQESGTADDLVARATSAAEQEKFDEALALLDQALAKDPAHRQALLVLAAISQFQADEEAAKDREASIPLYRRSAEAMRTLRDRHEDLRTQERMFLVQALFQLARAQAHQDQLDEAMTTLKEAIGEGLDVPEALEEDSDLDKLAGREDFQALKAELLRKAEDRAREQAEAMLAEDPSFEFAFELPDIDGKATALADLKGERVTIVDFWGTWCPPCRMEIPHFVSLYEKYKDQGLQIIGITYENTDDVEQAGERLKSFLETTEIPYPLVLTDGAILDSVPDFSGFPTTLFLDSRGKVRAKLVGYKPERELEALVTALMAEGEKTPQE